MKRYRTRTVVNNVSFEVNQGEIVGLLGPNGAGKTTSFYMVVGLVKPDQGEVFLNDQNITSLPMYKRAQMVIFLRKLPYFANCLLRTIFRPFSK